VTADDSLHWFTSGTTDYSALALNFEGKYSSEGVRQKLISLGLLKEQQQHHQKKERCCSSKLDLPAELPTIEKRNP
jgi:hypothetical protein